VQQPGHVAQVLVAHLEHLGDQVTNTREGPALVVAVAVFGRALIERGAQECDLRRVQVCALAGGSLRADITETRNSLATARLS
jgi:hypothetical protein